MKHQVIVNGASISDLKGAMLEILGQDVLIGKMKLLKGGKFIDMTKDNIALADLGISDGTKMMLMWKDGYRRPMPEPESKPTGSGYPPEREKSKDSVEDWKPEKLDLPGHDIVCITFHRGRKLFEVNCPRETTITELKQALSKLTRIKPEYHRMIMSGKLVTESLKVSDLLVAPKPALAAVLMFKEGHHREIEDGQWVKKRIKEVDTDLETRFKDLLRGMKMRTLTINEGSVQCQDIESLVDAYDRELDGLQVTETDQKDVVALQERLGEFREKCKKFRADLIRR